MISLAIIEDIDNIRENLEEFLGNQDEILVEIAAASVEIFLDQKPDDIHPDVLLLDIGLPGISGLGAIELLKENIPEMEIIMLTIHDDPEKIFRAIKSGASGYLLKNTPLDDIKKAVFDASKGGSPLSPPIARRILGYFNKKVKPKNNSNLTEKERLIITYLSDGLTYKSIAEQLNNSVETIKYHCKNIYRKLHVHSKAEVISKSLKGEI